MGLCQRIPQRTKFEKFLKQILEFVKWNWSGSSRPRGGQWLTAKVFWVTVFIGTGIRLPVLYRLKPETRKRAPWQTIPVAQHPLSFYPNALICGCLIWLVGFEAIQTEKNKTAKVWNGSGLGEVGSIWFLQKKSGSFLRTARLPSVSPAFQLCVLHRPLSQTRLNHSYKPIIGK